MTTEWEHRRREQEWETLSALLSFHHAKERTAAAARGAGPERLALLDEVHRLEREGFARKRPPPFPLVQPDAVTRDADKRERRTRGE